MKYLLLAALLSGCAPPMVCIGSCDQSTVEKEHKNEAPTCTSGRIDRKPCEGG
jgi:hypothetical protein